MRLRLALMLPRDDAMLLLLMLRAMPECLARALCRAAFIEARLECHAFRAMALMPRVYDAAMRRRQMLPRIFTIALTPFAMRAARVRAMLLPR